MRWSIVIYDFAPDPSEFPNIYEENFILFFISAMKKIILRNDKREKPRSYSTIGRCLALINIPFHFTETCKMRKN